MDEGYEWGIQYHVRFIDFDGIHRIGEKFPTETATRLEELGFREEWIRSGASKQFDETYLESIEEHIDEESLLFQVDQQAARRDMDGYLLKKALVRSNNSCIYSFGCCLNRLQCSASPTRVLLASRNNENIQTPTTATPFMHAVPPPLHDPRDH